MAGDSLPIRYRHNIRRMSQDGNLEKSKQQRLLRDTYASVVIAWDYVMLSFRLTKACYLLPDSYFL